MRLCEQKLCDLRGTGKCPICSECKAPPDRVSKDNCVSCWCCEHDSGYVRGTKMEGELQEAGLSIEIVEKNGGMNDD